MNEREHMRGDVLSLTMIQWLHNDMEFELQEQPVISEGCSYSMMS